MYIRTKDGVYEVEWNSYVEMWCDVKTFKGFILDSMISKVDYKLSENLAELCDEFVKIWNNTNLLPELLEYDEQYEEEKENMKYVYPKGNITIYGAVWTEWGLKYVAKMDDKGELELI